MSAELLAQHRRVAEEVSELGPLPERELHISTVACLIPKPDCVEPSAGHRVADAVLLEPSLDRSQEHRAEPAFRQPPAHREQQDLAQSRLAFGGK
eukprot:1736745-Pleurochrysis_carterae.AAC.1